MFQTYQLIGGFRFKSHYCRLCVCLHRFRFGHTKDQFKEYDKKYNIES